MSKAADPKLIGAFVLGAIVLITVGVLVLGGGALFRRTTPVVMFFEGSVAGLSTGAPVNFRGVRVGQVTSVFIRYRPDGTPVLEIPVFADFSADNVQIVGMQNEKEQIRYPTDGRLRMLVDQGLRAQLTLPSLVTGQASITLDFFPATEATFTNAYPNRVEIPTVPSTLQEVQTTLQQLYVKLSELPLDDLIADARSVLKGASRLANSPEVHETIENANKAMADLQRTAETLEARIGPLIGSLETTSGSANRTLVEAHEAFARISDSAGRLIALTDETMQAAQGALTQVNRTLKSADNIIRPDSQFNYELVATLQEAAAAARSLRDLADQLQRSPNSLLFGRPAAQDSRLPQPGLAR
jgi:paraquat-inducible protein B